MLRISSIGKRRKVYFITVYRYGYPVFIAGTCDANGSFHPTYCALASHEDEFCFKKFFKFIAQNATYRPTWIMADAAQAITNAVTSIFPNATRLMCWAHAIKNIDKRLSAFNSAVRKEFRREIEVLQYARNEEQFRKGR